MQRKDEFTYIVCDVMTYHLIYYVMVLDVQQIEGYYLEHHNMGSLSFSSVHVHVSIDAQSQNGSTSAN